MGCLEIVEQEDNQLHRRLLPHSGRPSRRSRARSLRTSLRNADFLTVASFVYHLHRLAPAQGQTHAGLLTSCVAFTGRGRASMGALQACGDVHDDLAKTFVGTQCQVIPYFLVDKCPCLLALASSLPRSSPSFRGLQST
ncbi:hypothetical protein OBBRIDRAFT_320068 [Obba rivulosa]|uniref:Uncharacterized protein n=1 Tax=Obba rivulosa TaxID=1052685 RepID=A0A8E2ANQ6_9APHY|nr:hypothetical protein OBBRIDRAFT_320068 [Obba rivulosa]